MAKKVDERSDYDKETDNNETVFREMLKNIYPELWVLMDMLETSGVNYNVLYQIIRHLSALSIGSKYGTLTVQLENGVVTFVRGEESTRVNENLVSRRRKP